jgi:hypothetical protein
MIDTRGIVFRSATPSGTLLGGKAVRILAKIIDRAKGFFRADPAGSHAKTGRLRTWNNAIPGRDRPRSGRGTVGWMRDPMRILPNAGPASGFGWRSWRVAFERGPCVRRRPGLFTRAGWSGAGSNASDRGRRGCAARVREPGTMRPPRVPGQTPHPGRAIWLRDRSGGSTRRPAARP